MQVTQQKLPLPEMLILWRPKEEAPGRPVPPRAGASCDNPSSDVQLPPEGKLGDSQDNDEVSSVHVSSGPFVYSPMSPTQCGLNDSHGAQGHGSSHVPLGSNPDTIPFSSKLGYAPGFSLCINLPPPPQP